MLLNEAFSHCITAPADRRWSLSWDITPQICAPFVPPPHSSASTPADSTRLGPTADIMFLFLFYPHSFVFLLFITINAWGESSSVEWSKRSQWRWAGTQAAQTDNVQPSGAFKAIDTTPEERLLKVWSPPFIRGAIMKDYLNSCGGLFLLLSLRLLRSNSIQPEDRSFAHPPPTITETSVLCYVKTTTAKKSSCRFRLWQVELQI